MAKGGRKPGSRSKYGLRVAYHDNVAKLNRKRVISANGSGWYIETFKNDATGGRWYSLMDLCFAREKDALWAVRCLSAADIDCYSAIEKAGAERVIKIATQDLQW